MARVITADLDLYFSGVNYTAFYRSRTVKHDHFAIQEKEKVHNLSLFPSLLASGLVVTNGSLVRGCFFSPLVFPGAKFAAWKPPNDGDKKPLKDHKVKGRES